MPADDDFYNDLYFPELQKAYETERKDVISTIQKEFTDKRDYLKKSKMAAIQEDNRHREIMNSCVSPFTGNGSLESTGYKFVHASPLVELNGHNVDFLLYKRGKSASFAIFGEAKGSIADAASAVTDFRIKIKEIKNQEVYIKTEYLKTSKTEKVFFEYVLAVPDGSAVSIVNKVVETGGGIIIWHAPITGLAQITMAPPPKRIQKTEIMVHHDTELNKAMTGPVRSNRRAFCVFPQIHIVAMLRSLVRYASPGNYGLTVNASVLKESLSKELFYMLDRYITTEVDKIIKKGLEIRFLETTNETDCYKIVGRGNSSRRDVLESVLEEKWLEYQINADLERKEEDAMTILREKYRKRRENEYKTLSSFSQTEQNKQKTTKSNFGLYFHGRMKDIHFTYSGW